MVYLTTHSTHFIYGYMASDIWLRTILIVRKETRCRHIGYSYRLTARVLLYAPSHRQDSTYHGLSYTSRGALARMRNSSMDPPLGIDPSSHHNLSGHSTTELHLAPVCQGDAKTGRRVSELRTFTGDATDSVDNLRVIGNDGRGFVQHTGVRRLQDLVQGRRAGSDLLLEFLYKINRFRTLCTKKII